MAAKFFRPLSGRPGRGILALAAMPALFAALVELASSAPVAQVGIDILAAALGAIACVVLAAAPASEGPRVRHGILLAAPAAASVAFPLLSTGFTPWALASAWVLIVAVGIIAARAGRVAAFAAIVAIAVIVIGSAVAAGSPGEEPIFGLAVAIPVITSIGIGLLVRSNRRKMVAERAETLARERTRMAHELHDVIAHEITGMVVLAQAGAQSAQGQTASTFSLIEQSGRRALVDVRTMVSALREADHEDMRVTVGDADVRQSLRRDVIEVLERFAASTNATVNTTIADEVDALAVGPRTRLVVLRVLSEGLTNIRRHAADATQIDVDVSARDVDTVALTIRDNGSGSDGLGGGNGIGLESLNTRVTEVGGTFLAHTLDRGGFELRATLPAGERETR